MKNTKKKKRRRSLASKPAGKDTGRDNEKEDERKVLNSSMEAFASVSLEEVASAYKEANGDRSKAADILSTSWDNDEDPSTGSISSGAPGWDWGSSSCSSEGFMETGCLQNTVNGKGGGFRGSKQKRLVAATGTVSTVLGKDYVMSSPRRDSGRSKEYGNGDLVKEEAEQFLCSMLGDRCELSMGVVKDVLFQCGYNVKKALDVLLDLSASTNEQSGHGRHFNDPLNYREDKGFIVEHYDNLLDRASDCTSYSSESELQDNIWSMGYPCRTYSKVLTSSEGPSPTSPGSSESDLPQKVLEALFNISKSPELEPSTMNWRNVVTKMQSLCPRVNACPSSITEPQQDNSAKGAEYQVFRKPATQHWDSMRSYYQKAAAAYSKGERQHAAYLSDQAKLKAKLARGADEKASQDIFKARNKGIENVITIDLHGQHVKQAMRLLKLHLLFGTYVPSIQTLRVITGCGAHGMGKSKLKQSVIQLVEGEGMEWSEENRGTVLIKLDGYREFSFLDSQSDTE